MEFKIYLKDGKRLSFKTQCNNIDYSNNNVIIAKHMFDDGAFEVLAIIPYDQLGFIVKGE